MCAVEKSDAQASTHARERSEAKRNRKRKRVTEEGRLKKEKRKKKLRPRSSSNSTSFHPFLSFLARVPLKEERARHWAVCSRARRCISFFP